MREERVERGGGEGGLEYGGKAVGGGVNKRDKRKKGEAGKGVKGELDAS
ncbi:hypothetical protein NX905_29450 [Burkholderia thailandensis]|nr:hypothetical protein [Burkholderia thailandensis]MCS6498317.1 hypothetical protein [Burkholderia thailandensis]